MISEATRALAPRPDKKQKRLGQRLYDLLHKRLGLSWSDSIQMIRAVKIAAHPADALRRRAVARRVIKERPEATSLVSRDSGSAVFAADQLPGTKRVAGAVAEIFEAAAEPPAARGAKRHLIAVMKSEDFARHREVIEFAVSRPVVDAGLGYFGTVPVLSAIALFWSPVNESSVSSQLFHLDGEDLSQLKLFVNVWDTREDQGPFSFLTAQLTGKLLKRLTPAQSSNLGDERFDDEFVRAACGESEPCRLIGPAGTAAFVDTSRCLHFGSRANARERLVLMLKYVPAYSARESSTGFRSTDWVPSGDYDDVQRLVLGI